MEELVKKVEDCKICESFLPLGAKPIFVVHPKAKIAIISQAPGRLAHEAGIAWMDPSGKRLRSWLGVSDERFYNPEHFCILPMGFCFPGKGKSGDLPPRKECAPQWHKPLLAMMPNIKLYVIIGQYAQARYLKDKRKRNLTETVRHYEEYLPDVLPLPHPSPRNRHWLRNNDWFETEVIPVLQSKVISLLGN